MVHLVGEASIGRTALAEQTAALAAGQGWTVVWGRAWGAKAAPPYWIWQQVLGSLARTTDVATRAHPATVAWLVDLVPDAEPSCEPEQQARPAAATPGRLRHRDAVRAAQTLVDGGDVRP